MTTPIRERNGSRPVAGNVYNKYGASNPLVRRLMNGFFLALSKHLALCDRVETVLEVGCGEGEIAKVVRPTLQLRRYVASDLDEPMVHRAGSQVMQVDFLPADATSLPFRDGSFELIIGCEVLEHIKQPDQALAELVRVGSSWYVLSVPREPLWRGLNLARGKYVRAGGNTPGHVNHWSRRGFIKLVSQYLEIIEVTSPLPWTFITARKR